MGVKGGALIWGLRPTPPRKISKTPGGGYDPTQRFRCSYSDRSLGIKMRTHEWIFTSLPICILWFCGVIKAFSLKAT